MLADALDIEESDVLRAVNEYTDALLLLDQYDHQTLCKPNGNEPIYRITYEECAKMVGKMRDSFNTDVFGVEKEAGKVAGIIAAVYQSVFGQEVYSMLNESVIKLLKNGMWDLATCANGEPNVVPVAFKARVTMVLCCDTVGKGGFTEISGTGYVSDYKSMKMIN